MAQDHPNESLGEMLRIEPEAEGRYTARLEDFWGEAATADLWARATLAASDTLPGAPLHSLHAFPLAPAPADEPLSIRCGTLDVTRGLARAEVRVEGAAPHALVIASFGPAAPGPVYADAPFPAGLPDPESLPSTLELARSEGWPEAYARGPIEFRRIGAMERDASRGDTFEHMVWMKLRDPLPDDPKLHNAALVFLSDFYPHWPFERRIGAKFAHARFAPRDHALWVHASVPWDDWWLLTTKSEAAADGRGFARRRIFTRDGRHLASSAQEALVATL